MIDNATLEEDFPLKKLYEAVDRFCARHPRFGIPNLMLYISIGTILVYVLLLFSDYTAISFLTFDLAHVLHGEVWRIITYIFVPMYGSPFSLLIALYFYYWIGSTLERQWGTAKFNLYYFSGVLLTVLGVTIVSLATGNHFLGIAGTHYVNLSMFLAFAALYPETQVLLFFLIPVKMKWLAWIDIGVFALGIVQAIARGDIVGIVVPLVALLNFAAFIWPEVRYFAQRKQYQHSRQTVQFKKAVKQQQQVRGYHHKCCVCGKTDTDHPDMQFRYCSKCAGYHCYCQDHIFSHVHFEEE
jgi:membrane associated rhomboid family serine protease